MSNLRNPKVNLENVKINFLEEHIRTYFALNGPEAKAVIGLSGGKDSAITAALLVRALGPERVVGIYMPATEENLNYTKDYRYVKELSRILNIDVKIVCIENLIYDYRNLYNFPIEKVKGGEYRSLTNTPARIRMTILYDYASLIGGRVINTCNYSEDYVGYSTKYGDLAGDFSVLKNFTYTEVINIGLMLKELPAYMVIRPPEDGMSGITDEQSLGFTYKELDNYILNNVKPSNSKTMDLIIKKHEQSLHKKCINIPAIPNPNGEFYNNEVDFS